MAGKFDTEEIKAFASAWRAAVESGAGLSAFAETLGVSKSNAAARRRRIEKALGIELPSFASTAGARTRQEVTRKLAKRGWSPEHDMTHVVPDGYNVKGTSTLYDSDGKVAAQWVKSSIDGERQAEMLKAACEAMAEDLPRLKPTAAPHHCEADLLTCYVVTDYHLGMLAWQEETRGEPWDMKIAEELLIDWFSATIAQTPASERAVFAQLGDFVHFDGLVAATPEHGNILDADTRFQKLVRTAIRVLRQVIGMLLTKHKYVHILMAEGNHDPASSVWLREWFNVIYENEPRVTVDVSPDPYYCVEHGDTSLFFHHGHRRNPGNISDVFAAKFRDVFGRTKFSYAHMGHRHHAELKENSLMVVEQHRTLAANDAYASRGGWLSGRDAKAITYSKRYGEVSRVVVSSDLARAANDPSYTKVA